MESSPHFIQPQEPFLIFLSLFQQLVSFFYILIGFLDVFLNFVQIMALLDNHIVDIVDHLLILLHSFQYLLQFLF